MMSRTTLVKMTASLSLIVLCSAFFLFIIRPTQVQAAQATYFVAPNGSNSNPGTFDQPFQTIEHARSVVSSLTGNMSDDIVVNLRGGTYSLGQSLTFGPGDSGTNGHNVIYQAYEGETPVISGGQTIGGWSLADGNHNIWQAPVGTELQTRQLYVNGLRATRARSNGGLPGSATQTGTGYTTSDTSMQSWGNPSEVELVYTGGGENTNANWVESRCGISSISGDGGSTTITMDNPCYDNAYHRKSTYGQGITFPSFIENAYELLDQPGEWYLDRSAGNLFYIPNAGEDLATATVIAPTLETLVSGNGTLDNPIHNIQFKGLTFAYATWLRPSGNDGFAEIQANHTYTGPDGVAELPQGNLAFQAAHNIRFERNTFVHLGSAGLRLWNGSRNNVVIGNVFTDISGSGVIIGDVTYPNPADSRQQDRGNQVINNYIHNVAAEYHGGVGIFGGYLADTLFAHNEIHNLPYSGISLGWGWGTNSFAENNQILDNLIYNIMGTLFDGAGIYTLSEQGISSTEGRSTIAGNYIHSVHNEYGALYPDEGSARFDIYNNVSAATPRWLNIWTPSINDITVHDNYSDTSAITQNGTNITLYNNYTGGQPWPQAAQDIINNAGIEPAYQDIKDGSSIPTNLALYKSAFPSSEWSGDHSATKANDGNTSTGWSPTGEDGAPWWMVDLGSAHRLTQIQLVTRQELDQPETRQNFEIWASNNADMSLGHVVLASQGSTSLPFQSTLTVSVTDPTAYRYVAAVKTGGGYFYITELRVLG